MKKISYGRHDVNEDDIKKVIKVLRSNNLTMGNSINKLEHAIARFTQTKGAVAVSSGTAALHCAYSTIDLKNKEVITSPLTFIATASAAIIQGAKVVFSDIDIKTGNVDPLQIKSNITNKTSVVTCVDYAGNPVNLLEIKKLLKEKNILLFDDASHSFGSKINNKIIGGVADMTIFSFFPTKNITSGEGGALVSNNVSLLKQARYFKMHGLVREKSKFIIKSEGSWHQEVHKFGLNYRLSEIHAALALSQLERIHKFKKIRSDIFESYVKELKSIPEIELPTKTPGSDPFWHLFPIKVEKQIRKKLFNHLRHKGIIVQVNYLPVYLHPVFKNLGYKKGLCPNAENFYEREISLPIHTKLKKQELEYIIEVLTNFFR